MRNNKKGFTLIEILAAITIMGILSIVAVVSVNRVIQNGKREHYVKAEDSMKMAGQSYFQKNRNLLPKVIGQKKEVSLKVLVDNAYISAIKDYSSNQCDLNKSYVQVYKYSQNDYSYLAYLECPSYNSKKTMENYKPSINVQFVGDNEKSAKAKITITDSNKLISYSYIVYRGTKEIKNTGSVGVPNYDTKVTKTVDLSEYTPGKLKIVVTATNIYGNSVTATVERQFLDAEAPKCIIKEEDVSPKPWITSGSRKITVGCDDGDGSGCTKDEFTKTFKDTIDKGIITISDEAGNTTDCVVSVNIDKGIPSVPTVKIVKWKNNSTVPTSTSGLVSYTNNSWSNLNLYAEASNSSDVGSGIKEYQYVITGKAGNPNVQVGNKVSITTEGTSTIKFRACDVAGNCSAYSSEYTMKLDKTAPSVPTVSLSKWKNNSTRPSGNSGLTAYTNNTWSTLNIYTVASSPEEGDDTSKIKHYQYVTTGATANATNSVASSRSIEAEGTSTIKYRVCDNAGNCSAYSPVYTVKIDKTKPTITSATNSSNSKWTNGNVTISAKAEDGVSGIKQIYYYYNNDATLRNSWGTNNVSSVSSVWAAERDNEVFVVAIDNAGNRSDAKSVGRVRIDKTKPKITSITNNSNGNWTNGNVTISANASDSASGIKQFAYYYNGDSTLRSNWSSQTATSVSSVWSVEMDKDVYFVVTDNAGNKSDPLSAGKVRIDKTKPVLSFDTAPGNYDNNSGITVTSTCTDSRSGVASHSGGTSISSPNSGQSVSHTCTDKAGNTASVSGTYKLRVYNANSTCGVEEYETCACGKTCPSGYNLTSNGNYCYKTLYKNIVFSCKPGFASYGGKCSPYYEDKYDCPKECAEDYHLSELETICAVHIEGVANICISYSIAPTVRSCPSGYTLNSSNTSCYKYDYKTPTTNWCSDSRCPVKSYKQCWHY